MTGASTQASCYPLQHDEAKLASLIDPEKNARWALMERQILGKYMDAQSENWGEILDRFKERLNERE